MKKHGPRQVQKNAGVGAMGKFQVQIQGDAGGPEALIGSILLSQELANYSPRTNLAPCIFLYGPQPENGFYIF